MLDSDPVPDLCSTPCGITEVGTHRPTRLLPRLDLCSTPCGITEVGTHRNHPDHDRRIEPVLNALRHHRGRHGVSTRGSPARRTVLNALRHHRGRHTSTRPSRSEPRCAQRLAASQRSAQRAGSAWISRAMCSTPCGITEVGTPRKLGRRPPTACAQRLAASQRSARFCVQLVLLFVRVLNALRHHRGRHLRQLVFRLLCDPVLNALRHHRGRHFGFGTTITILPSAQRLAASQRSAQTPSVMG